METMTTLFFWLGNFIPLYIASGVVAGAVLVVRARSISGALITVGAAAHLTGYLSLDRPIGAEETALSTFLPTLMFPGSLLVSVGMLSLAFSVRGKRPNNSFKPKPLRGSA
jgi:hypothetical protein